ncbi:hypothetical protein LBMAG53_06280 [Planctomycetota bacterium]|nr:hypothetical protein LBMAG53_06280 [Planctomycetota bacterium]
MKALKVIINHNKELICGIENGVLSFTTTYINRREKREDDDTFHYHLGALDIKLNSHIEWSDGGLDIGDKIFIEMIKCQKKELSKLKTIKKINKLKDKKAKEKYVVTLAKELGWTITKNQPNKATHRSRR